MTESQNALLDKAIATLGLANDAALSRVLQVAPPVISKVRHGKLEVGTSLVQRIHEVTGWPLREIKGALGLPCLPLYRAA